MVVLFLVLFWYRSVLLYCIASFSETQWVKSLVETYFAVAMCYVDIYINKIQHDLNSPSKVVDTLQEGQDIGNSLAKLVYENQMYEGLLKQAAAARDMSLSLAGLINRFQHVVDGDVFNTDSFEYTDGMLVSYVVAMYNLQLMCASTGM